MSAVVLPISPVEGSQDSDSESEADWGSEFDDSTVNDPNEDEDELYEVIGDISRKPNNVSKSYLFSICYRADVDSGADWVKSFNMM